MKDNSVFVTVCLYTQQKEQTLRFLQYEKARYWLYDQNESPQKPIIEIVYENDGWYWLNNRFYYGDASKVKEVLKSDCVYTLHGNPPLRIILFTSSLKHSIAYELLDEIFIGRQSTNTICFQKPFVSAMHASIKKVDNAYYIIDEHSSNGVYVNHQRVQSRLLQRFDIIHIMSFVIIFMNDFIVIQQADDVRVQGLKPLKPTIQKPKQIPLMERKKIAITFPTLAVKQIHKPTFTMKEKHPSFWILFLQAMLMQLPSLSMLMMMTFKEHHGSRMQVITNSMMFMTMLLSFLMMHCMQWYSENKEKKLEKQRYEMYLRKKQAEIEQAFVDYEKQWLAIKSLFDIPITMVYQVTKPGWLLFLAMHKEVVAYPLNNQIDEYEDRDKTYCTFVLSQKRELNLPLFLDLTETKMLGFQGEHKLEWLFTLLLQLLKMHNDQELKVILMASKEVVDDYQIRYLSYMFVNQHNRLWFCNQKNYDNFTSLFEKMVDDKVNYVCIVCLSESSMDLKILEKYRNQGVEIAIFTTATTWIKECDEVMVADDTLLYQERQYTYHWMGKEQLRKAFQYFQLHDFQSWQKDIISFTDIYQCGNFAQLNMAKRWQHHLQDASLSVCIGMDEGGNKLYLDAHEGKHGPHGLIAGMTGSGKSEFILSYIVSLCLNYSCEEVAFILIDYKGGMMADALSKLPHVAYIQTNLEKSGMYRFIASLHAELHRRQELFKTVKQDFDLPIVDMDIYQQLFRNHQLHQPLPHLFIIADEFAELKDEQPKIIEQLNKAARIGRSLGIHLILATQKPYGVIDDQIWSNARFHVCLKVQNRNDSMDMLKKADACFLQEAGAFYLQVGNDEIYVKGKGIYTQQVYQKQLQYHKYQEKMIVQYDEQMVRLSKKTWKEKTSCISQLAAITDYICNSSAYLKVEKPFFMHPVLTRETVCLQQGKLCLGRVDDVEKQRQYPFIMELFQEEKSFIIGRKGSGKVSFLKKLLYECQRYYQNDDVTIFIFDGEGHHFDDVSSLSIVSDVLALDEVEKVESFHYQILHIKPIEHKRYVLMIHDYAQWLSQYEHFTNMLIEWMKAYSYIDLEVIITVNTIQDLPYQLHSFFTKCYCMQLYDTSEYAMIFPHAQLYPMAQSGSGIMKSHNRLLLFQIDDYDKSSMAYLKSFKQAKKLVIPLLEKRVLYQAKKHHLYLGKALVSKMEQYVELTTGRIIFIMQAFTPATKFKRCLEMEEKQCCIYEDLHHEPMADDVNVYFLTLASLANFPYETWYLQALYQGDFIWIGEGLQEIINILKLPMACMNKELQENEALWYRKGKVTWIKVWEDVEDG